MTRLIELWETGLPSFWVKSNTPQAPQCFAQIKSKTTSARQVPIRLNDLFGAFFILGIGVGSAIVIFCFEKLMVVTYLVLLTRSSKLMIT